MKNKIVILAALGILAGFTSPMAFAEENVADKASEAAKDTGRGLEKGARTMGEKGCELVNGKMDPKCLKKKAKNKAKNTVDKVEDIAD